MGLLNYNDHQSANEFLDSCIKFFYAIIIFYNQLELELLVTQKL